jgi:ferritin-like metal-binding protein YciE
LIRSTQGRAETTILLWQDIEYHLTDAKRQIERIRRIIEQFELQKR